MPGNIGLRVLGSNWIFTLEVAGAALLWFVLILVTLLYGLDMGRLTVIRVFIKENIQVLFNCGFIMYGLVDPVGLEPTT